MGNIPLRCGVTGAGLSVTKAGLHTHISPNVTKQDGKNKTISCVKIHKTGYSSTIYGPFEVKHEKGQKALVLSHNPEVAGSNPVPATNKSLKSYDFSDLYFYNFFGGLFLAIEN